MSKQGWIGVDLDGTLAHYDIWRGPEYIGEPVAAMVERVKRWLAEGREVRIMTARVALKYGYDYQETCHAIRTWCKQHLGRELPLTSEKDGDMLELWDDRAVTVEANTGRPLAPSRRGLE